MTNKVSTKHRFVRCPKCQNVLPEPPGVPLYECGGCGTKLQAKKRHNTIDDTTTQRPGDDSSGKQKMEQVSDDQEAGSSSNQQLAINSIDKSDPNSDHNNLDGLNKDQDPSTKAENGMIDEPSDEIKGYSSIKLKMKQQSLVNTINEPDQNNYHNDPCSSTELSGHDQDPESSPKAIVHKRMYQEQEEDKDQDPSTKAENGMIDEPSDEIKGYSSIKLKMKQQSLVNTINEPDQNNYHNDPCSSTELSGNDQDPESSPKAIVHKRMYQEQEEDKDQDPSTKAENGMIDEPSDEIKGYSSIKLKMKQQSLVNTINEPDQNNYHNDPCSSTELSGNDQDPESSPKAIVHKRMYQEQEEDKDQDPSTKAENGMIDEPSDEIKGYSSIKLKMKQQSLVNTINEPDQNNYHNDPCSSTELSGHDQDPESSPKAIVHKRMYQEQQEDKDQDPSTKAENGMIDEPSDEIKGYCSIKLKMKQQSLANTINEPDQNNYHNDPCSSTELSGNDQDPESSPKAIVHKRMYQEQEEDKDQDPSTKAENGMIDEPSDEIKGYSLIKLKMKQQSLVNTINEPDQNNYHNDPCSSTELSGNDQDPESSPEAIVQKRMYQEQQEDKQQQQDEDEDYYRNAVKNQENVLVDTTSVGLEYSSGKQIIDQLSDEHETGSCFNQLLLVNSVNEIDQNSDHNSSEATFHNRIDQDSDQEFVSCRKELDFEESSSEFEEAFASTKIIRDSDGVSKSSFKSIIAEKLLDTRHKKLVYLDEDDILSQDGSADLHHCRRFDRISSVETVENTRFGGTNYYGSSESSFDRIENKIPRKNRINRRNEFHSSNVRLGKNEQRSIDVRSLYSLNEFNVNSRHRSPMIPENPKMERIELLKMVRDLQDQLEKTNISNSAQQLPSYYNHILNNPGRYGQRMAFSGEVTAVNGRRDGNLCHHCCPQDRRFSEQLPRQHVCSNGSNTYYGPHFSSPSSPRHLSESEFSAPDDHRYRKPYRSPMKKRYVRPISGGSPWITCYRCSELLQLPQNFLVFKKRCHSLRCGACLKVLNFTLLNGTHVSRYYPEETIAVPPSSEVEDYDKSTWSRAGPVSCSDGSFQKCSSTETDRNGSREFSEEKRKATMLRDTSDSTRPSSSKVSSRRKARSEIKKVGAGPNGSPLHWLMGYPSPSKVIRG